MSITEFDSFIVSVANNQLKVIPLLQSSEDTDMSEEYNTLVFLIRHSDLYFGIGISLQSQSSFLDDLSDKNHLAGNCAVCDTIYPKATTFYAFDATELTIDVFKKSTFTTGFGDSFSPDNVEKIAIGKSCYTTIIESLYSWINDHTSQISSRVI